MEWFAMYVLVVVIVLVLVIDNEIIKLQKRVKELEDRK